MDALGRAGQLRGRGLGVPSGGVRWLREHRIGSRSGTGWPGPRATMPRPRPTRTRVGAIAAGLVPGTRAAAAGRAGHGSRAGSTRRGGWFGRAGRSTCAAGVAAAPYVTREHARHGVEVLLAGRTDAGLRILDSVLARFPLDSVSDRQPPVPAPGGRVRPGRSACPRRRRLVREFERVTPEILKRNDPERVVGRGHDRRWPAGRPRRGYRVRSGRSARSEGCQVCWLTRSARPSTRCSSRIRRSPRYEALVTTA